MAASLEVRLSSVRVRLLLVVAILLSLGVVVQGSQLTNRLFQWTRNPESYQSLGKRLTGHVVTTYTKYVNSQCALECLRSHLCKSFNFDRGTGRCEINSMSHLDYPADISDSASSEYHVKEAFSIDPSALGPCASNPCRDNGHCIETKTADDILIAVCLCKDGWTGSGCQFPVDSPTWGQWAEWGQCSVSCQRGWRMRTRNCEDSNTGQTISSLECYGADVDYGICVLQDCPKWEEWGAWGECSTAVTCGRGFKVRRRSCRNGGVPGVDRYCLGSTNETTPCQGIDCQGAMRLRDGVEHGEGRLEVYNDVTSEWGLVCADQVTGVVADLICRQIGFPGAYAAVTDGRFGMSQEQLSVTIRHIRCQGGERRMLECQHNTWNSSGTCDGQNIAGGVQCSVNGVWSLWGSWGDCSVTCENGTRQRTRTCSHPPQKYAGKPCDGETAQYKPCQMDLCPDLWSAWSAWSACDAFCGGGKQSRDRTCVAGTTPCSGANEETRDCDAGACPSYIGVPINGVWNPWSDWSSCSATCGNGTQSRSRTCRGPFFGGKNCSGNSKETQECASRMCPVDGVWSEWAAWGACTLTCGNGTQSRNRTCVGPFYGGRACQGSSSEWGACNDFNCPVDGEWAPWQQWQTCNVTCGGGQQIRVRQCYNPLHGGSPCVGVSMETRICGQNPCPLNGVWKTWSEWSTCSVTCGAGVQLRNRTCDGPYYGGAPCVGEVNQTQTCQPRLCPVDGLWMDWGAWSSCSLSCGGGRRTRARVCYGSGHAGTVCLGNATESVDCNTNPCPVDGVWNVWGAWGVCTQTCGNGTRMRDRKCNGPFYGGANCTGPWQDTEYCSPSPCPKDGVLQDWEAWSTCSLTCGTGWRTRHRKCAGPFYGGLPCAGYLNETETCYVTPCPVDGAWSVWGDWSPCTTTCGGGTSMRSRTCVEPVDGGARCQGDFKEERICSNQSCPVDGVWSGWSAWGACDVTCGGGTQQRQRSCVGPYHGGQTCAGQALNSQVCNVRSCPVDGVYDTWSQWSACSVTCGGGSQWRARVCIGPFHGGAACTGPANETRACSLLACPKDGVWEPWTVWTDCSATCGGGHQQRERKCVGVQYGGRNCTGDTAEKRDCNAQNCPVDGVFSDWSMWTTCTLTCGGGSQWRNRTCVGPFYGGLVCQGAFNETRKCSEQSCPVDGMYGEWSPWSECSLTCDSGTQQRSRTCIKPQYGGRNCSGPANETQECNIHPCPVDGYFHDWADWSTCTATCGGGSQWRNRVCQPPLYGGRTCVGVANETQACNAYPCPIDGVWQSWSNWSVCDVTCGGGSRLRSRVCVDPKYGGQPCVGSKTESTGCANNPCPIPGNWLPWTQWSTCTLTCGGGVRERSRACDLTVHGNLTAPCIGSGYEKAACHTFACTPYARTCTEWATKGLTVSTMADIDPDGTTGGLSPIRVYCDLAAQGGIGVTVIGHDSEERTQVQGWEGACEYKQPITYNVSFEHVKAIIDQSAVCMQFIRWECKAALIHNPNDNQRITTGWLTRTGALADYFGGALPGSGKCACGMTSSCADRDLACNCDSNDDVWREDSGNLTYKPDLPVTAFVAGDTGGQKEDGYGTLGPVECYGAA